MSFTAEEIALRLGGDMEGSPSVRVDRVARIEQGEPGAISFLANPKYEHFIYSCRSDVMLVNRGFIPSQPLRATLIRVDDAYAGIADVLRMFSAQKAAQRRRGHRARVGRGSRIDRRASIGRDVVIGEDTVIHAGAVVYDGCVIGSRCIIHSGAVIGADGFGFAPQEDGSYSKIPQTGNVVIEDDVEIGANTTIDRATMGSTVIRRGVKIDNLCHVAHNVEIGENTVIAALSGFAGSCKIGACCRFGGQSGVIGHVTVADHTTLAAKSGITGNVLQPGQTLCGYPAIPKNEYLRAYALMRRQANSKK